MRSNSHQYVAWVQIVRELHPREESGRYVLHMEVVNPTMGSARREVQVLHDKIVDLMVHKTQLKYNVSKKEVLTYIRK